MYTFLKCINETDDESFVEENHENLGKVTDKICDNFLNSEINIDEIMAAVKKLKVIKQLNTTKS
jgi:hypothetical protein